MEYKNIQAILFSFLTAVVLAGGRCNPCMAETIFESHWENATNGITREIRYSYTIQNTKPVVLNHAEVFLYAPVKESICQRCLRVEVSSPAKLIVDEEGNQILHFSFDAIPPYGALVLTIKASVFFDSSGLRDRKNPSMKCTKAGPGIECDAPEIQRLALELHDATPDKTARKANDWISRRINDVGYISRSRGALYALRYQKGDCTEQASLFVALCRANGIPARMAGGYFCPANMILSPSSFHNWAEFYDGEGWCLADPSKNAISQQGHDYIAMNVGSPDEGRNPIGIDRRHRVIGDGLTIRMEN